MFFSVFEGVPQFNVSKLEIESGITMLEFLSLKTSIFSSKGEAKKMIAGGGISINKEKITSSEISISAVHLLNNKYILVQKGKKEFFIVNAT